MSTVDVHKHRTTELHVILPYPTENDIFTSQVRKGRSQATEVIVEWNVSKSEESSNKLILVIDDELASTITETTGYMDIKRVTAGEPLAVFNDPILVTFKDVITE